MDMVATKPLCSGMGEVVPARTLPTLLPPSPRTMALFSRSDTLPDTTVIMYMTPFLTVTMN